jgi:predicted metal-dependent hydrolase
MESVEKELLFIQLVMQNQQLALMSLGKLKNPVTDKLEKNLEFAKMSIDILDMLKDKTKGNSSEYEEQFINEIIKTLKLDYVYEIGKGKTE